MNIRDGKHNAKFVENITEKMSTLYGCMKRSEKGCMQRKISDAPTQYKKRR